MGRLSRLENFNEWQNQPYHGSVIATKKFRLPTIPTSPWLGGHNWKTSITDNIYLIMGRWLLFKIFDCRQYLPALARVGGHDWKTSFINKTFITMGRWLRLKFRLSTIPTLPCVGGHPWQTSITDNTYLSMGRLSQLEIFDYQQYLPYHWLMVATRKLQ